MQASDVLDPGTMAKGGTSDRGTIFRMDLSGEVDILHSFEGGLDNKGPAHLMQASDAMIYGTDAGGANDSGRISRLEPSGGTTALHSFDGSDDFYRVGARRRVRREALRDGEVGRRLRRRHVLQHRDFGQFCSVVRIR